MDYTKVTQFFVATMGKDGAKALLKAAQRSPVLATAMMPRGVLAWLNLDQDYEGVIPGVENTYITFQKTEAGYQGRIEFGEDEYLYKNADLLTVAASIGVALGLDVESLDPNLRKSDFQIIGTNMDALVKAHLSKGVDGHEAGGPHDAPNEPGKPLGYGKPGQEPDKDRLAVGTQVSPKKRGLKDILKPKKRMAKLKLSESLSPCSVCDATQFQNGKMTLCYCLRDLAKSAKSTPVKDGYQVEFGADWSDDDISVFLDMVRCDG